MMSQNEIIKKACPILVVFVLGFFVSSTIFAAETVPFLGKYVPPEEAYEMWLENPKGVKIIDCRTPEEYLYVGHAFMAYNIPSHLWTGKWNLKKKAFELAMNPDFVVQIQKKFSVEDDIVIMCRSGGSAESVNRLVSLGFKNVYSVINGFEGSKVTDKDSRYRGKRMKNGWKNSCLPWTYKLNPRLVYAPAAQVK